MEQDGKTRIGRFTVALVAPLAFSLAACDGKEDPTSIGKTQAALTDSKFEIEGNLVVDTAGNLDWVNVPGRNTPGPAPGTNGLDENTGQGDDAYAQGAKNDDISPAIGTGGVPGNKDDLQRFYVANEHVACVQTTPASSGCPCQTFPNGCEMLYIAWEREGTNGAANVDMEFNQLSTPSGNGETPLRSPGDMIVSFDFEQGGVDPTIRLSRWITTGANSLCEANNGKTNPGCWNDLVTLNNDQADAEVNDDPPNGVGTVIDTIANPDVTLAPREFGEAAINLTSSGVFNPSVCLTFGKAFAKTRSSFSFTSTLKDLISPINVNINNCRKVQLLKVDQDNAPLGGAVLQLWKETNNTPGLQRDGATPDTQVGANCTSAAADSCSGTNCSFADQGFGTYYGFELTPPAGYNGGPPVTKVIDPSSPSSCVTITLTDAVVPGTVNIEKDDDLGGFVNGILFTLSQGGVVKYSCTTAVDGKCSMTGVALGTYSLDETVPAASGYAKDPTFPKSVTIVLGPSPGVGDTQTFTAVNPVLHKVIVFVCDKRTDATHPNGTLLASSVTLGTGAGSMLTSFATAPTGLTEAILCGITTGATFDNKPQGTYSGQVVISH